MEQNRRYTSYRVSNYMQGGLAVLKISSSLKSGESKDINVDKTYPHSKLHSEGNYQENPIKTTKNFIGKPCYNVGRVMVQL